MRRVREVIVVEGRYDKNALRQVVDATVVETRGFGVFNDKERLALLRDCQAHISVVLSSVDMRIYKKLGLQVTCEPKYETKKLYHR